jgi:hypothetical protein
MTAGDPEVQSSPAGPAPRVNCHLPVRLCLLGQPSDDQLEELSRVLARNLARAQDVLAAHGRQGTAVFQPLDVRWIAPPSTHIAPAVIRGVAAALRRGLAPPPKPPTPVRRAARRGAAAKTPVDAPWRVVIEARFHTTPRKIFDVRETLPRRVNQPDPNFLRDLYFPLLDVRRPAVAWVVEVLREAERHAFSDDVTAAFVRTLPADQAAWGFSGWSRVRRAAIAADQDGVLAGRIPEFGYAAYSEVRRDPSGTEQFILRPGAYLLLVLMPLPRMRLEDVVEIGARQTTEVTLREAGTLVAPKDFEAEVGLQWKEIERGAADAKVTVCVDPFTVRRKVHERTLDALFRQHRQEQYGARRLGRVVRLGDPALQDFPPLLQAFLAALPGADAPRPSRRGEAGFWPAGTRGASLAFRFPADLEEQALLGLHGSFVAAEAVEAERILGLENTFWNANRNQALGDFIDRWRDRDPKLFGLVLAQLERQGKLTAFLDAVRGLSSLDAYRRRTVIALAVKTRYFEHPGVLALVRQQEELERSLEEFVYDVDAQEVWIDGDRDLRLRAAGDSPDDKAGVVAVIKEFYSESSRIYQLRPEVLDLLSEPTKKKVGEYMARTVCAPGETLTHEQLVQKAMEEAAKELTPPLEEKHFVKVTLTLSIRVLKLERRLERGLSEIYVHFQEVRKIGDQPWEPSGELRIDSTIAFEARLRYYVVQQEIGALTLFFLAQTVLYGGLLIIHLGIATLGQLLFFVAVQVVIYRFTTDAEDRTLEGYLCAALKGELDAIGFKLISGFVKGAGQLIAGKLISSKLVSEVATKWIVFTLRGITTAVGMGGLEVTLLFAEDLLSWSYCKGWSSPEKYWDRFETGFWMTMALEFVAIPILAPPLRFALQKAKGPVEAAKALLGLGKPQKEVAALLMRGSEEVEAALARTVERAEAVEPMARSFRERVAEVIKALGREYESRAYRALLELYGPSLGPEAARGLRRLLVTASEGEIDRALQRLLALRASGLKVAEASDLFRALDALDDPGLARLVRAGQLTELTTAPRLVALLNREPALGARLLMGPFKVRVGELERYLGSLEALPAPAQRSIVVALLHDDPLPPNVLLGTAQQVGVLGDATLVQLRRLLGVAGERQVGALLQRLAAQHAPTADLLRALQGVDDALLGRLAKGGQLAELGTSRRLLALLTRDPAAGSRLLAGPFKSVATLEGYLAQLEGLAGDVPESVLRALQRDHPLPPNVLLGAAQQAGVLDDATVAVLERLRTAAGEQELEGLFQKLAAQKAPVPDFLRAVGGVNDTLLGQLARSGQLADLGASPRLLAVLAQDSVAGTKLLTGPFESSVSKLESYLARLEELPAARDSVIRALLQDQPLPPEILLSAAREVGALDDATLALLRRLRDARIQLAPLFGGRGPTLTAFSEEFARLSEGERLLALQLSPGKSPADLLAQARTTRGELRAVAREIDPTPEYLRERLEAGRRPAGRALVLSKLRAGPYQTAILDTVVQTNARELARMRASLRAFNPDAILGAERSGPFIAEAATYGEPALADRIVRFASESDDEVMRAMRTTIEALIAGGQRRFAFTEVYFSGSAVRKLIKDVIRPLARAHPECQFRGLMVRESLGFETVETAAAAGAAGRAPLAVDPTLPSNVVIEPFHVPFAVGDDAARIIQSTKPEPVFIFDREGRIVEVVDPRPGERTARETVIRLLGESGGS